MTTPWLPDDDEPDEDDEILTGLLQTVSDRTAGLDPAPDDLTDEELDILIPWADDPNTESPFEVN